VLIKQVMMTDVLAVYEDQPVEHAVALMEEKKVGQLAVLDRQEHLVGVVSLGELKQTHIPTSPANPSPDIPTETHLD
jgi:CBS domain-containing protein